MENEQKYTKRSGVLLGPRDPRILPTEITEFYNVCPNLKIKCSKFLLSNFALAKVTRHQSNLSFEKKKRRETKE